MACYISQMSIHPAISLAILALLPARSLHLTFWPLFLHIFPTCNWFSQPDFSPVSAALTAHVLSPRGTAGRCYGHGKRGTGREHQLAWGTQLPFGLCFGHRADVAPSQPHEAGRAMPSCPEQTAWCSHVLRHFPLALLAGPCF